ncbi:MAG: 2-phosphosulfolactate phosphatase [Luteibaculum sp.]
MDSKPTVEVCFSPDRFHLYYQSQPIVVVIDVLRATTAMCVALEYGVEKIIPVSTLEEATEYQRMGFLVGAEREGQVVDGFLFGNSPVGFMTDQYKGKTIVLTTTNGTRAINTASKAKTVVAGSFVNMDSINRFLADKQEDVLLLCSGWKDRFNLEDTICAGGFVDYLIREGSHVCNHDSSVAAKYLYQSARDNYMGFLKSSSHRRRLKKLNLQEDIKFSLKPNQTTVIPILVEGELVKLDGY